MKNEEMKGVWLIGGGGHAKVIIAACESSQIRVNGLLDENETLWDTFLWKVKISPLPENEWWETQACFLALGNNQVRKKFSEEIKPQKWETIIHPTAIIHKTALIGEGSYIGAYAVIQPDVLIGNHTIINTGAIVEHDTKIGSFCHIAPRAILAGGVSVGEGTLVGVGSSVIPGISVGSWIIIGAGSAVIDNISSHKVAVGVPCRIISSTAPTSMSKNDNT